MGSMKTGRPNNARQRRQVIVAFILIVAMVGSVAIVTNHAGDGDWALTRRVVDVPFEMALEPYIDHLEQREGVTSATYTDYNPVTKTAMVTVTFDPSVTSARIVDAWLGNTTSVWEKSVRV